MAQFYWFLAHEQFQPEVLVRHAQLAESAGFDGVMVSDHFHPWVDDVGASGFAFATLGAIAQATSRLKLMTSVTSPLFRYHPALVAQAAATVDRLSSGRFSLGVGSGEALNEVPLGHEFPQYKERAERMREAITILRRLLDGETLDFGGQYYQTAQAKLYSPPAHHVPIYLAAGGPKSAALAGELADGVVTSVKDEAQTVTDVITPARAAANTRSFAVVASRWTVYGENENEVLSAIKPWRGLRVPNRATTSDPAVLRKAGDELGREHQLTQFPRVTSNEDIVAAYQPLVTTVGADIVGIQMTATDPEKLIQRIGSEVLPILRKQ